MIKNWILIFIYTKPITNSPLNAKISPVSVLQITAEHTDSLVEGELLLMEAVVLRVNSF